MHTETTALVKSDIIKKALIEIKQLKQELHWLRDSQHEPIAVIGMACRFPGGITNPAEFWQALVEQRDLIGSVPAGRWEPYRSNNPGSPYLEQAGFLLEDIEAFDHRLFRFSPKEAERTDPQQRLFLKICWEALENSGYAPDRLKGSKTGVYAGVSLPDYLYALHLDQKNNLILEPDDITGSGFSFLSGRAAYFFGFQGPGITLDTACSSSLVAVDQALKGLMAGDCDMAIAGGVNLMYSPATTELLATLNILSPDCVIRSFDAKANGTVRGEGGGVVILKKLAAALRDGDRIHAIIRGSGVNQDGPSSGLTAPYGPAQEKLINDVWRRCRLDCHDIGYIEAHGTGTELGDPIEVAALANVLKDRTAPVYLGTVKTNIGHLEAAAGIAGLIKTILAVENGVIPGNLHFETPSPHIEWEEVPIKVPARTLTWETGPDKPRIAGVSSFGLSGTNAHVVVEQYCGTALPQGKSSRNCDADRPFPFKFSSVTEQGLCRQLEAFLSHLEKAQPQDETGLANLSYSLNSIKADLPVRMVIWARSAGELKENIKQALAGRTSAAVSRGSTAKKVVFLFTGQGSQYPAMFADFYRENRIFRSCLDECNTYYQAITGQDLRKIIFSGGSCLHETRYTQPALFAVEYALARLWQEYGVEPVLMAGHSVGEYTAACLAGVFTLADAVKLITARGELMYSLPRCGRMAAVLAGRETVSSLLAEKQCVTIAATNTPGQTVISGDEREVNEVCDALAGQGIKTVPLQVSHAFHSPLMAPMLARFEAVAQEVKYSAPVKKLLSNVTGGPAGEEIGSWQYWSRHIPAEVRFYDSIRSIENPGEYVFLEIGPAPVLTAMVECICGDGADCIVTNYPDMRTGEQLARSLFYLYNRGAGINWQQYYADSGCKKVAVPNYRFTEKHFGLVPINNEPGCFDSPDRPASAGGTALPGSYRAGQPFAQPAEVKHYVRQALIRELKIAAEELDDNQNLLLYGLNSIVATRLAALWRSELAVSLQPGLFLSNCTVNKWAEIIYEKTTKPATDEEAAISFLACPEKRYEPFLLNEVQYAYWAGRNPEMDWGGVGCYASFEIDMDSLEPERFGQALRALVQRHEMLRAVISPEGTQTILPVGSLPLTIYRQEAVQDLAAHLKLVRQEMSTQVIPLGRPMFDVRLTEMDTGRWRIHFGIDFLIADALSLYIFWKDLTCLYAGEQLPVLEVSYRDYLGYTAGRRQTRQYELAKKYWQDRVGNFPAPPQLPVNLPAGKPAAGKFVRRQKRIDRTKWQAFVQAAARQNLTPSAALLSLYAEVLAAWGAGSRFAVMLTVFDRERVHPQIDQIIGDFTQLMLVEIRREQVAASRNAAAIQAQMLADMEHSHYSAIQFVKELNHRENSRGRMYPVVFTSALGMQELPDAAGPASFLDNIGWTMSSTPQVWLDHQVYPEQGGVALSWDALEAVFLPEVLDAMFEAYTGLVERAAEEETFWSETISDLRPERQRQVQQQANNTGREIKNRLLHEGIRRHAASAPEKAAVVSDDRLYTYRELINRADQVAELLQEQGIKPGDRVALQMKKSCEQIAVVLGIVQTGAAYIPMACDQSPARTLDILRQAQATILFVDDRLALGDAVIKQVIPAHWEEKRGIWQAVAIKPADLAYVIYTSGSTGTPKGVAISHQAAMNTILEVNRRFEVTAADSILGVSALSFDLSVYDIFGLLTAGGTLVLPTEAERLDPKSWRQLSLAHSISLWNSVPALMDIYTDFLLGSGGQDTGIRQIILSGDWIPLGLFSKIRQALPHAKLTGMGGATEAAIWSNYYDVEGLEPDWNSIPYGYPLANQSFYILDEFGRPCPDWVQGKLHIAGKGLADGYLNEPELTSRAFFQHAALQQRLYDTGDYGRYRQNGIIEFLGRKDSQLKINGHRIETGDIQAAFAKCGLTGESIILPVGDRMESKKLIAYVKVNPECFTEPDLKKRLNAYLPGYCIPERIIAVNDFPVTSNGKIDRKKLLEHFAALPSEAPAPASCGVPAQQPVLQTVRETLNLADLQPSDNLGDLGVSSIDMIRLANRLEAAFGERPSVGEMVGYQSVAELLDFYRQRHIGSGENQAGRLLTDPRFCLFSEEQLQYLSKLEPLQACRQTASLRRTDLADNKRIPLSFAESGFKQEQHLQRQNSHEFLPGPLDTASFQQFLALCLQQPSASDSYPVQIYLSVFAGGIAGMEAGSYYLDVADHSLVQLHRQTIPLSADPATSDSLKNPAFILHFVGDLAAVYPVYEKDALKFCFIETGLLCQRLETYAGLFDIGCCRLDAYAFEQYRSLFDVTARHCYLHSLAAGKINYKVEKPELPEDFTAIFKDMERLTEKCRTQEIQLWLEDDRLKFKAPAAAMTQEIQAELKANKASLIRYLREFTAQSNPDCRPSRQAFSLTPLQLAYVLGRSPDYELGNTSAHYYAEFECPDIDPVKLENAVNEVIGKQEMLRTVIYANGTQQVLAEQPRFSVPVQQIDDRQQLSAIRSQWSHHTYELGKWPMFHIQISQLGNNLSRLHFSFDCLIVDGWSAQLLFREIFRAYYGHPVLAPGFTFREYISQAAGWLEDKSYHQAAARYWEEKIKHLPPAPALPFIKNFSEIIKPHFRRLQFVLSAADAHRLRERIKKYRFTPSAVICTAYMKVLSRWSSRQDLTLNLTLFNRLPLHEDVPHILGDFTNIALISFFSGSSFVRETKSVQEQLWQAVEYRTYNGLDLLRRLAKDSPGKAVMPVVFTSLLFGEAAGDTTAIFPPALQEVYAISQTPQVAIDHQAYERDGSLVLIWDVVEEVFAANVVEAMFAAYRNLIDRLIAGEDWDQEFTVTGPGSPGQNGEV
ncbi:hybrid non-ribosomal peptide synthetase/type I polyketide synthase [Sporomusa sphaeroides]|uniref:Phenolphthiocerol synthesis polyketide synthase type I Pks15/1 n=1 Tax=Sporomusa sphaeroides DSM 2875 TaxID=1337886 RepID=A0ABM9W4T1_9FIRM|nr:hybrid non-ribosomal peptide synthetase/type I polyketide synthase [Sporomusa sphaeroides]OLS57259.1 phenolphthiocerol synthesis polyketide synthase type I Pks15/1 [Sporomusa sphaeroides DSM 2875]CVK20161.1 Phenolphthiocerol synthesis polyketide synthase type I Pks15/1 [Sporomusa sphaeroides DSM 2875]